MDFSFYTCLPNSFSFKKLGLLKTYAVDAMVPDSACTATALFTGVKTNFEMVGIDAGVKLADCESGTDPSHYLSTIAEWAQKAGKSTGKYLLIFIII